MVSISAIDAKLQELPHIELSYETFPSHRKVPSPDYTIGIAIPRSKKYIAWFTFIEDQDVCLLLELNREKRVVSAKQIHVDFDRDGPHLALGTFLYGSLSFQVGGYKEQKPPYMSDSETNNRAFFIIEDILMYRAVSLRKLCFGIRLGILERLLSDPSCLPMRFSEEDIDCKNLRIVFTLPMMFDASTTSSPPTCLSNSPYKIHHVQYRSLTQILPYMNVLYGCGTPQTITDEKECTNSFLVRGQQGQRMDVVSGSERKERRISTHIPTIAIGDQRNMEVVSNLKSPSHAPIPPDVTSRSMSRYPPQPVVESSLSMNFTSRHGSYLKQRAIFLVTADLQSDIYHLVDPTSTYTTDVAYIHNYQTSVFMNSLFRNIKENRNLDAIEESDDEDDFYDMRMDKYVDLTKEIRMECVYHSKFRRWIPYKTV